MSGVFRPEQNTEITATDDEALAKAHGLDYFDEESGQYVKRDVTEQGDNEDPAREDADVGPGVFVVGELGADDDGPRTVTGTASAELGGLQQGDDAAPEALDDAEPDDEEDDEAL